MSLEHELKGHFTPMIYERLNDYITNRKIQRKILLEVYYIQDDPKVKWDKNTFRSIEITTKGWCDWRRNSKGVAMMGCACLSKESILEIFKEYLEECFDGETYLGEGLAKRAEIVRKSLQKCLDEIDKKK